MNAKKFGLDLELILVFLFLAIFFLFIAKALPAENSVGKISSDFFSAEYNFLGVNAKGLYKAEIVATFFKNPKSACLELWSDGKKVDQSSIHLMDKGLSLQIFSSQLVAGENYKLFLVYRLVGGKPEKILLSEKIIWRPKKLADK